MYVFRVYTEYDIYLHHTVQSEWLTYLPIYLSTGNLILIIFFFAKKKCVLAIGVLREDHFTIASWIYKLQSTESRKNMCSYIISCLRNIKRNYRQLIINNSHDDTRSNVSHFHAYEHWRIICDTPRLNLSNSIPIYMDVLFNVWENKSHPDFKDTKLRFEIYYSHKSVDFFGNVRRIFLENPTLIP